MPNPKEIFATISDSIGAAPAVPDEDGQSLSVSSYDQKPVAKAEDFKDKGSLDEQQLNDDYAFVRKNLQDTIETAQSALQNAVEVAAATGNPEIIASVSSMVASVIAANKALLEIQNQVKKTKLADLKLNAPAKGEEPGVTNNFFIGTVDEMLQALEKVEERRGLTIEGEFKEVSAEEEN